MSSIKFEANAAFGYLVPAVTIDVPIERDRSWRVNHVNETGDDPTRHTSITFFDYDADPKEYGKVQNTNAGKLAALNASQFALYIAAKVALRAYDDERELSEGEARFIRETLKRAELAGPIYPVPVTEPPKKESGFGKSVWPGWFAKR